MELSYQKAILSQTVEPGLSDIYLPQRIVSGGQTGVDRAALDWAISVELPHGGWCPINRLAEDGRIPDVYLLKELKSHRYADRTRQNVVDSDATLILYGNVLEGGTLLTARLAKEIGKELCVVRLYGKRPYQRVRHWLNTHRPKVLNVAGPRASNNPKIYELAFDYLSELFFPKQAELF